VRSAKCAPPDRQLDNIEKGILVKHIAAALVLALVAACAPLSSQGGSAPEDNFQYPQNSRWG